MVSIRGEEIECSVDDGGVLTDNKGVNVDELFAHAVEVALETGIIKRGDIVVITAGIPPGQSGTTNMLKAHEV